MFIFILFFIYKLFKNILLLFLVSCCSNHLKPQSLIAINLSIWSNGEFQPTLIHVVESDL